MPPVYVMIKPASGACNLRCRYCFYADVSSKRQTQVREMMSAGTLETVVRRVFSEAEGEAGFAFQGGEPTLAGLDFFREFIRLERKYNVRRVPVMRSIQTNGTLIDAAWAQFLKDNGFLVGVSLDGNRELHDVCRVGADGSGSFAKAYAGARTLRDAGVQVNILCVVTNFNARHGDSIYRFFRDRGFKYFQFIPCIDPFDGPGEAKYSLSAKRYAGFLKTVFDRYFEDYMRGQYVSVRTFDNYVRMLCGQAPEMCGMSGVCSVNFMIESNGDVYPCDFYMLDEYFMGNVRDMSFSEMMSSDAAERFADSSLTIPPQCAECEYGGICRGGCRRDRETSVRRGYVAPNVYCEAYREFFSYAGDRLCMMAESVRRGGL